MSEIPPPLPPPARPAGGLSAPPAAPALSQLDQGAALPDLDDRERWLDPRMVVIWRVFGGLGLLFPLIGISLASFMVMDRLRWLPALAGALFVLFLLIWYPRARYRAWRWRLTDIAIELRYGVLVHRHEAVPYFRVQQIDISQGPLDRLLGLATLQVTTASSTGSAGLPGIPEADAPQIRHQLLNRAAVAVAEQPDEVRDAV